MSKSHRDRVVYFVKNQKLNNSIQGIDHLKDKEENQKKNGKRFYTLSEMPKDVQEAVLFQDNSYLPIYPKSYDLPSSGHPLRKQRATLKKVKNRNERAKNKSETLKMLNYDF